MKTSTRALLALHGLLALYSVTNIASKLASGQDFLSPLFIVYYGLMMLILAVYAIGWQQIIKRMPLTTAYANKAVTVVWGIIFGTLFFDEKISAGKLLGAVLIIAGIVLFALEDGRMQDVRDEKLNRQLQEPEVHLTTSSMPRITPELSARVQQQNGQQHASTGHVTRTHMPQQHPVQRHADTERSGGGQL